MIFLGPPSLFFYLQKPRVVCLISWRAQDSWTAAAWVNPSVEPQMMVTLFGKANYPQYGYGGDVLGLQVLHLEIEMIRFLRMRMKKTGAKVNGFQPRSLIYGNCAFGTVGEPYIYIYIFVIWGMLRRLKTLLLSWMDPPCLFASTMLGPQVARQPLVVGLGDKVQQGSLIIW